jgi:hypothetical protein
MQIKAKTQKPFTKSSFPLLSSVILLLSLTACTSPRPFHGGRALTSGPLTQSLSQPENPAAPSRQTQDTIRTLTYTLSDGRPPGPSTFNFQPSTIPPQPVAVVDRQETHATTELGASQKDTARELAAKLSSLKGITWLGAAIFILGLASLFWPPLQAIIGSVTTSAAITLGGLALIILPTLAVGHELLILAGVAAIVAAWFLAHRHGHLRGQLAAAGLAAPKRSVGGSALSAFSAVKSPSVKSVKSVVNTSSPRKSQPHHQRAPAGAARH